MLQSRTAHSPATALEYQISAIRNHLAEHMVGQTVNVLTGSKKILHGTVAGVFSEAGTPKIVVNGHPYELHQVLTSTVN